MYLAVLVLVCGLTSFLFGGENSVRGHRMLVAGCSTDKIAMIGSDGKLEWSVPIVGEVNDACLVGQDKLLYSCSKGARMIDRDGHVLWEHKESDAPAGGQIHSVQMLDNGNILIAKSCIPPAILEIAPDGKIMKSITVHTKIKNQHGMFRQVRKTPQNTYLYGLVSGKGESNKLYEVNEKGEIVKTFPVALHAFAGVRLPNGNTLIAGGDGHEIVEYNAEGNVVWKVCRDDLPGRSLAFVAGLQRLPNGNTVFTNWHGHEPNKEQPQVLEISPDKKVVWEYKDFTNLSYLSSIEILDKDVLQAGTPLR